jgi:tetratricopeptide (TPR) repeat protein
MAQRGLSSGGTRRGGRAARAPGARPGPEAEGTWGRGPGAAPAWRRHAHADSLDIAQAEAYYQQALALAEELGMRPLVAHCYQGLGTLYGKIGRPEQARPELSTAIALYRTMDMTFWLPQTEAALAQVEGR